MQYGGLTYEYSTWGQRMGNSVLGSCFGLFMVIGAVPLLWWNEGNWIHTARALEEGSSLVVDVACTPDKANLMKLVHIDCPLSDLPVMHDPFFNLNSKAVFLARTVEMYQNFETSQRRCKKQSGGGQSCVTDYHYGKKWSSSRIDSDSFRGPRVNRMDLRNPSDWPVESHKWLAPHLHAGEFILPIALIKRITGSTAATLPQLLPSLSAKSAAGAGVWELRAGGGEAYYSASSGEAHLRGQAQVGDVRVTWSVSTATAVSVVAQQQRRGSLEPYQSASAAAGYTVYMLAEGDASAATMFAAAEQQNAAVACTLRLVGFLLIAVGLQVIAQPLSVALDAIPCVGPCIGDLASGMIGCAACLVALPISLTVIALAWLAYRPAFACALLLAANAMLYFAHQYGSKQPSLGKGGGGHNSSGGGFSSVVQPMPVPSAPIAPYESSAVPTTYQCRRSPPQVGSDATYKSHSPSSHSTMDTHLNDIPMAEPFPVGAGASGTGGGRGGAGNEDFESKLKKLAKLRDEGVISQNDFDISKEKILNSI